MQFVADAQGAVWAEPDDHGQGRRRRWRQRSRARAIAYVVDKRRQSDDDSDNPLKRLKSCGLAKNSDVEIRVSDHHAFASGLISCGNIWTCPTCSARIRARRVLEDEIALTRHVSDGGSIGMITLTVRHNRKGDLSSALDNLNHAWRRLQQSGKFARFRGLLVGTISTLEITYGENGWHPHLHVLLLVRPGVSSGEVATGSEDLREAWSGLVNRKTDRYTLEHGLNLVWFGTNSLAAAQYVNKIEALVDLTVPTVAMELNLSNTKSGLDPFVFLDRADKEATALFIEYARATYRRQAKRWSSGLRRRLQLGAEKSDEEVADDNETVGVVVMTIAGDCWNSLSEGERLGWLEFCEAQYVVGGGAVLPEARRQTAAP